MTSCKKWRHLIITVLRAHNCKVILLGYQTEVTTTFVNSIKLARTPSHDSSSYCRSNGPIEVYALDDRIQPSRWTAPSTERAAAPGNKRQADEDAATASY